MTKLERMYEDLSFFIECISGRKVDTSMFDMPINTCSNSLGNCEAATPGIPKGYAELQKATQLAFKQQGNNPMRIENTTATAYVTAAKSDEAASRDYLLSRLERLNHWSNPKVEELRELFNMDAPEQPETYQQLIDAIKGDKFTLDPKKVQRLKDLEDNLDDDGPDLSDHGYGPFYAMVFTDLPKADKKGYAAALKEYDKLKLATKDAIMVASPADGLKALQALEAWLPAGKAN